GEYFCGGGFADHPVDQLPSELKQEGEAMLRAVVEDLSAFAQTTVILEDRFQISLDCHQQVSFDPQRPLWAQWVAAAKECDSALIIAPESDGELAKGVAMLRSGGVDVVAGSGDFLRVASDKLLTAQVLHSSGVAHPPYIAVGDERMVGVVAGFDRFVVKPRDGCGTQAIETFKDFREARKALSAKTIMQGFVPGQSISVSLITSGNSQTFLPAVSQEISDSLGQYVGGCGPLNNKAQRRATALAARAIAAMPPTARGFVGLDLILGDTPSQDCVIEINPRLTTSYVGLREMIHGNLAARLFDIETGPVSCKASVNSVRWTPDGEVFVTTPEVAGS
ncbi:MAG: ATP-grasp domain-containing protein, partial [Planctomycetales bacterium]|nr:ATP-grasp domain-containing protein [Planctomycetales bacterium]